MGFVIAVAIALYLGLRYRSAILADPTGFSLGFLSSLLEDIVFFGLVGLGLALAQFSPSGGEHHSSRLRKLFGNQKVDDHLIDYFSGQVRQNGVYSEVSSHHINIEGYDTYLRAYKLQFCNTYELHNAFGDISFDADMTTRFIPDIRNPDISTVAELIEVSTTSGEETVIHCQGPKNIPQSGLEVPAVLTIKPDQKVTFMAKFWSFAANMGQSGFSVRRFSKRFEITVTNKSNVSARIAHGEQYKKIATLRRGETFTVAAHSNVSDRTRVDFHWLPPLEHDKECDPSALPSDDEFLTFLRRIDD